MSSAINHKHNMNEHNYLLMFQTKILQTVVWLTYKSYIYLPFSYVYIMLTNRLGETTLEKK